MVFLIILKNALATGTPVGNHYSRCQLNQLKQFLVSFTWKYVSTLGLLHMVS